MASKTTRREKTIRATGIGYWDAVIIAEALKLAKKYLEENADRDGLVTDADGAQDVLDKVNHLWEL